jgi:hypothetical protein
MEFSILTIIDNKKYKNGEDIISKFVYNSVKYFEGKS